MSTNPQTKLRQKNLMSLRKWVDREISKTNRKKRFSGIGVDVKFSYKLDSKSNKVILCYTIPVRDKTKKKGYKKVHKEKYGTSTRGVNLKNYKDELNVVKDYEFVCDEVEDAEMILESNSKRGLRFWIDEFCSPNGRRPLQDPIKEKTLENYRYFLDGYYEWLEEYNPRYLTLNSHNSQDGVNKFLAYLDWKKTNSIKKDGWATTTIHNCYRSVRSFFNWVGDTNEDFRRNLYSNLKVETPTPEKQNKSSFTINEFRKVLEFMDEFKEDKKWFWFIPMLRILLVSGCRISELVNMKINDLELSEKHKKIKWEFYGKNNKKRTIYIDGEHSYNDVMEAITDEKGKLRTDKDFVFHRRFYKSPNPNQQTNMGGGWIERLDLPYSISGIQHKFKKMTKLLKINERLTPHSCRRFFTIMKLRETNGDMNLTRVLLGHSSLKMVMYYHRTDTEAQALLNRRNTLDLGKVLENTQGDF